MAQRQWARKGRKCDADMSALISALPEENLRPFVEGLVGSSMDRQGNSNPGQRGKIERGL